jgi:hypothetical protein
MEHAMPKDSFEDPDMNGSGPLDDDSDAQARTAAATDDERATDTRARNDVRVADASDAATAVRKAVRSTTPRSNPSLERDLIMVAAASYLGFFIARLTR